MTETPIYLFFSGFTLGCVVGPLLVLVCKEFVSCPIWSETLNTLMDADVEVGVHAYRDEARLGPASIRLTYPYSFGESLEGLKAKPNLKTKMRLRKYIARKQGISLFEKGIKNNDRPTKAMP
jgi:hypothetical protein